MSARTFPFSPKSLKALRAGDFWSIPLVDGRFGCGRVLRTEGVRGGFIGALLDWVGTTPPTIDAIAGLDALQVGHMHIDVFVDCDSDVLGHRPLEHDTLEVPAEVRTYLGWRALRHRANHRWGYPARLPRAPQTLFVRAEELLQRGAPALAPRTRLCVSFSRLPEPRERARLVGILAPLGDVALAVMPGVNGLDWLADFSFVHRVSASALSADDVRRIPESIDELVLHAGRVPLDLAELARFRALRELFLEGPKIRHVEALGELVGLETLTLRSVPLSGLAPLEPLRNLRSLDLKLGGTTDLSRLPRIGRLEHLELWRVKGLSDLRPISEVETLRYLFLQTLKHVDALPDLRRCAALVRAHLETLRALRDLRPLVDAPALRDLLLADMPQLELDDLACLVGHPTLRAVTAGIGGARKQRDARRLLGLPETREDKIDWREV